MAIDRLIGSDARLEQAFFATPLTSGSASKDAWYRIEKKTGDTVFPKGFKVGDVISGELIAGDFSATNSGALASFTTIAEVTSFNIEVSKDETEVTTLADLNKQFRAGKQDFSGTVEGITIISEARKKNSIMNRFFRIVDGVNNKGTGTAVMHDIVPANMYIRGLLQSDENIGETMAFFFARVELFGYGLGASVGDAQNWSSGMRLSGSDPIIYFVDMVDDPAYTYTVIFDNNGGDTEANPQTLTVVDPATTVGALPIPPTHTTDNFVGWNTVADGSGTPFYSNTPVTADITVYAMWM